MWKYLPCKNQHTLFCKEKFVFKSHLDIKKHMDKQNSHMELVQDN